MMLLLARLRLLLKSLLQWPRAIFQSLALLRWTRTKMLWMPGRYSVQSSKTVLSTKQQDVSQHPLVQLSGRRS